VASKPGGLFSFPNPVNEVAARLVAGGVVLLSATILLTQEWWLLVVLAYGFVARVATGPTMSPLAQLATKIIVPGLGIEPRPVPGPPKRFAQGIGAVVTTWACVLHFGFGADGAALVLVALITFFATLESVFGFCVGCKIFGVLMRAGIIPESVCIECADIGHRRREGAPA
jgi:hypothetical protein